MNLIKIGKSTSKRSLLCYNSYSSEDNQFSNDFNAALAKVFRDAFFAPPPSGCHYEVSLTLIKKVRNKDFYEFKVLSEYKQTNPSEKDSHAGRSVEPVESLEQMALNKNAKTNHDSPAQEKDSSFRKLIAFLNGEWENGICKTLGVLQRTRDNHPSFKLMAVDEIDEKLYPEGIKSFYHTPIGETFSHESAPVWNIIKESWEKEINQNIVLEGAGGIGKTVTLFSVADKEDICAHKPTIYIQLFNLVDENKNDVLSLNDYLEKYFPERKNAIRSNSRNQIEVWDETLDKRTLKIKHQNLSNVTALSNSLCVSIDANRLYFWNPNNGKTIWELSGHKSPISCIERFSDDYYISGTLDGTLQIWNPRQSNTPIRTLTGHTDRITVIRTLSNGFIISFALDNTTCVWNLNSSKASPLQYRIENTKHAEVLKNGQFMTLTTDDSIQIWDSETGILSNTIKGFFEGDTRKCFWMYEGFIAGTASDCILKLWSPETGACIKKLGTLENDSLRVTSIGYLQDGRIISGSYDGSLRIWNKSSGKCLLTIPSRGTKINHLSALPDGRFISGSEDGTLRIWNSHPYRCLQFLRGHRGKITCVISTPEGLCVSGSSDYSIRIWNPDNGTCQKTIKLSDVVLRCCAILPNGLLFGGFSDNTLRLLDLASENCYCFSEKHQDTISCIAILDNGLCISGSDDQTIRIWDVHTKKCLYVLKKLPASVSWLLPLPDGMFVSCSRDGYLCVWDSKTATCIKTYFLNMVVYCLTALPTSYLVYITGADGIFTLDFEKKPDVIDGPITSSFLPFSPSLVLQNKHVITAGGTGDELYIWDFAKKQVQRIILSDVDITKYNFTKSSLFLHTKILLWQNGAAVSMHNMKFWNRIRTYYDYTPVLFASIELLP